jgi:hypothetical protein
MADANMPLFRLNPLSCSLQIAISIYADIAIPGKMCFVHIEYLYTRVSKDLCCAGFPKRAAYCRNVAGASGPRICQRSHDRAGKA